MVNTFGDFEFDDRRRCLKARGEPVRLSGQALDLLCLRLERPGELITREEAERRLWPDRTVDWSRRLLPYAVVAIIAAILAILFAQTRYDKFVPSHRSQISPTVPGR